MGGVVAWVEVEILSGRAGISDRASSSDALRMTATKGRVTKDGVERRGPEDEGTT